MSRNFIIDQEKFLSGIIKGILPKTNSSNRRNIKMSLTSSMMKWRE